RSWHHHVVHAGRFGRLNSRGAVFKYQAVRGRNSNPTRCFQKRIRVWFSPLVVFGTNHRIEDFENPNRLERGLDGLVMAARGNSQRLHSVHAHGNFKHWDYRVRISHALEVVRLLPPDGLLHLQGESKGLIEVLDDHRGRLPSPLIEKLFWKLTPKVLHRLGPGTEMDRHRVCNRSITVEDVSAKLADRYVEFHSTPINAGLVSLTENRASQPARSGNDYLSAGSKTESLGRIASVDGDLE